MSKGSARRPTDDTAYSEGWARVFGNKERDAKDGDLNKQWLENEQAAEVAGSAERLA